MTSQKNYFIIPGNPPAAHFYKLWGEEIAVKTAANVRISVYPLLKKQIDSGKAMDEVLISHLEQLHVFQKEVGQNIIVIGHSLGGYFALKLLEVEDNKIEKAILLHPFLRSPSLKGKLLLNSIGSLYTQERIQNVILKSRKILDFISTELPYVTNEEILKSFHLARHESKTIGRDLSSLRIREDLKSKTHVFYSKNDAWCTADTIARLTEEVSVSECEEPHGFITKQVYRRSLFEKIYRVIK